MNLQNNSSEIIVEPESTARGAVIWLHGLGADGSDFVPIVAELQLPRAADIRFVFPHAPVRPVTLNGGMPMRAWYDILSLDADQAEDAAGIRASEQIVRGYLARQQATGIAPSRIVLAGFSQGGAIALHSGLRVDTPIAGLIVLSAYLPLHARLDAEATPAGRQAPIFIAHGSQDPVVPCAWGEQTAQGLKAAGYSVDWHRYPMAHEVCAAQIADIGRFLHERLC